MRQKTRPFLPLFFNFFTRQRRRGSSRRSRKSEHICWSILVVGAFLKNSSIGLQDVKRRNACGKLGVSVLRGCSVGDRICAQSSEAALEQQLAPRRPFFDDVGHLPARRRCRERNLYTLCWGKRAAGESSALPRRHLASLPFTLHEHWRVHLGQLLRQPRLRVADVRVRRRLRGLRPAHAALAPAATGLQPTAPHHVNSGNRGTSCPLHQHCHSHRNAS